MQDLHTSRSRVWISLGFFALFVVGIVGVVLATGWEESFSAILRLTWVQVGLLLALSLVNYGFRALRWHIYTRAMRIPTDLGQDIRHYLAGFAMTATPGRLGEFVRLRWIWRETGLKPDATGALVLVDRAADLAAVGIALAASIALATDGLAGASTAAFIAVALAILATRPTLIRFGVDLAFRATGLFPNLCAAVRRASRRLAVFARADVFIPATLLGLLGWSAEAYAFDQLLSWMGADIGMPLAFAVFFFAMLTGGATGMPGGVGGAEAAMIAALHLCKVPLEIAIPATAIIRLTTLWFAIVVGMVFFPLAERLSLRQSAPRHAVESSEA